MNPTHEQVEGFRQRLDEEYELYAEAQVDAWYYWIQDKRHHHIFYDYILFFLVWAHAVFFYHLFFFLLGVILE